MAANDCGFCEQLYSCQAGIVEKDFYSFAAKMLCVIAENTVPSGVDSNVNVDEVGGVAVTIADFQSQNLVKIAGETLGASFYDQTLQAIQESIVANSSIEYNTGAVTAKTQRVTLVTDVGLPAGTNLLGKVGIDQTTPGTTNGVVATGNVASDGIDSGNPLKIGHLARTSDITAVANADRVDSVADKIGRQVIAPYAIPEDAVKGTTADMTGTTSTSVVAGIASNKIYITDVTVSNMSAAVATRVDLQDGSGGAVLWQGPAAAAGGGYTKTFNTPIPTTAGNGVFAVCATTGAQVQVSVAGYKGV